MLSRKRKNQYFNYRPKRLNATSRNEADYIDSQLMACNPRTWQSLRILTTSQFLLHRVNHEAWAGIWDNKYTIILKEK